MNISNAPSATQTATNVWATAIRRITGLGTSLATAGGNIHTAVANGSGVSLQPSAGSVSLLSILGEPLANVTWALQLFNGTTTETAIQGASGAAVFTSIIPVNNSFYVFLANQGTVSGNYSTTQMSLIS